MTLESEIIAEATGLNWWKWLFYLLLVLAIFFAGYAVAYNQQAKVITKKDTEQATLQAKHTALIAQVDSQNKAIDALAAEGARKQAALDSAIASAAIKAAPLIKRAAVIMAKQPASGVDLCTQASRLVDEQILFEQGTPE